MDEEFEIKNKVAASGLVNFDLAELAPRGDRVGIDLKDFLWQEMILKEKDFREKVAALNVERFRGKYVHIYNSADAIVPLWSYFLLTSRITGVAKKVIFGSKKELEMVLWHDVLQQKNFEDLKGKRVLVKGCTDMEIPENVYIELVEKLRPEVKSLMFGEACSNVPIFKN